MVLHIRDMSFGNDTHRDKARQPEVQEPETACEEYVKHSVKLVVDRRHLRKPLLIDL